MHLTKYVYAAFLIFLILPFSFAFVAAADVGVEPGHWAKYTGSFVGYEFQSITLSITSVTGTYVEGTITYQYIQADPQTQSFEGDVLSGDTFPYVVPANLNVGDTIYYSDFDSPEVEGVTSRSYAGASRNVVYSTIYTYTYYWDQETGILVEQTWGTGAVTSSYKLTETNIWGGGIFDTSNPIFWILLIIIIVIVALVLLAVVLQSLRKKKVPPGETVATPTSTEQPSPPKEKIETKKYCPKCGAGMPLDAVYCPKCAHKHPET